MRLDEDSDEDDYDIADGKPIDNQLIYKNGSSKNSKTLKNYSSAGTLPVHKLSIARNNTHLRAPRGVSMHVTNAEVDDYQENRYRSRSRATTMMSRGSDMVSRKSSSYRDKK